MSSQSNVYCGTVTSDGMITSNGNFSCQTETGIYSIDYNGNVKNPVPVLTLTSKNLKMTYYLNSYSGGFKLYVYDENLNPIASGFNFIVAEIV